MENIQEKMKALFGGSCYAYCLCKLFGDNPSLPEMTQLILKGWQRGYIENDGFVSFPVQFINMINPDADIKDVVKVNIDHIAYIKDPTIVEYVYNGGSHFVIVENGRVIFDPSGDSNTVRNGKAVSLRKYVR